MHFCDVTAESSAAITPVFSHMILQKSLSYVTHGAQIQFEVAGVYL